MCIETDEDGGEANGEGKRRKKSDKDTLKEGGRKLKVSFCPILAKINQIVGVITCNSAQVSEGFVT